MTVNPMALETANFWTIYLLFSHFFSRADTSTSRGGLPHDSL